MPTQNRASGVRPWRPLALLITLIVVLGGSLAAGNRFSDASWFPALALDLEGGTQIILTPQVDSGTVDSEDVEQAIEVIRQRVDSSGVTEAEITSQGGSNIVVALPGDPDEATLDLVRQSAQMRFRTVLQIGAPGVVDLTQVPPPGSGDVDPETGLPIDPQTGEVIDPETGEPLPGQGDVTDPEDPEGGTGQPTDGSTDGSGIGGTVGGPIASVPMAPTPEETEPPAQDATEDATAEASDEAAEEPTAAPEPPTQEELEAAAFEIADVDQDGELSTEPVAEPVNGGDPNWITEQTWYDFYTLDCSLPENRVGGGGDDPTTALVACSREGEAKYVLGPAELEGDDLTSASSGPTVNAQGQATGGYSVRMEMTDEGSDIFSEVTTRLSQAALTGGTNQFAIVLDALVISAPGVNEPIPNGQAEITGPLGNTFSQSEAAALANQLNFGALPIFFTVQSEQQISATLGSEQLERGLLAGLIGLVLVIIWSLIQYRGLAMITVASLVIAALITMLTIVILSWLQGYRLSLPGVTGLIVAIGVTADSFVVYFERIRDEVREGRPLGAAVEQGWRRARRTIIISDAVNLLAAIVLYFLSVGGVRGFAFTLGLTTIIDLLVVFLFTHPVTQLLVKTRFFSSGHRWSGVDPGRLGAKPAPAYRGRGGFRTPEERVGTIAERRRLSAEATSTENEDVNDADLATSSKEDR